jgi:Uma2 family endonuclease
MDVRASDDTQVEPDIFVVPLRVDGRRTTRWEPMTRLLLAIEVLSPATRRLDQELKRELYLGHGVREYWIVDADARSVEVWTTAPLAPTVVDDQLTWQPRPDHEPLTIDLARVFRIAHLER